MASSAGGSSYASYAYQQQQLALQKQQLALQQQQHEESMALQREALDKPVASIAKTVSLETQNMVENQQAERSNLKGIRSTYSMFRKKADSTSDNSSGKTKLGT